MLRLRGTNHLSITAKSAGTTNALAANDKRKYAEVGGSQTVGMWIGLGQAAVVGTGPYVGPGTPYIIDQDNLWTGSLDVILASGVNQVIGGVELT